MARRTPTVALPVRTPSAGDVPDRPAAGVAVLADLAPGSRATVVGMAPGAPAAVARRLQDLGLTGGVGVEVVRRAPLGDPVIYRIRDYELCLRRAQAACVLAREIG